MSGPDPARRTEHRMERTYRVVATPEQVWEAIATAKGISSWMAPTRLDPRVGGEVSFDFGHLTSTGVVTAYSPPERFAFEEPWPLAERPEDVDPGMAGWLASLGVPLDAACEALGEASPVATEFLVESESGGSCVIRVVTSAYGGSADWEREFFAEMAAGFAPMLERLASRFAVGVSR
ncbi:SRPBCC family protein [Agromyces aurantiacus]|uniref:SRPBCC family protein n=1 Tax=Agromyces aurantiacus TaxID=165814 RepID=A0ABV9R2E6_9MICO|nr:SRPBCC domain-containing protein [Agromyces aurantiacus]MBM7505986.1 uncharacterized protein YndB with AHSA1/START domain [Agromyces aurantiacus]